MSIEIVEIHELRRKRQWYERFRRDYDEQSRPFDKHKMVDNSRFFVAKIGSIELGYIHIDDKSSYFDCEVWNITEAYVKPKYRGNGILREMISHVVANFRVQMMHISWARYEAHLVYYQSLGFSGDCRGHEPGIGWVFRCDFDVEKHLAVPRHENENEPDAADAAA